MDPQAPPQRFEGDLPAELVELILFTVAGIQPEIYHGLYKDFPLDGLPEGFDVIGSVDQGFTRAAFLRSPLPAGEGERALMALAEQQGWQRQSAQPFSGRWQGGFIAASAPDSGPPTTYRREDRGQLSIAGREGQGGPVLVLRHTPAEQLRRQGGMARIHSRDLVTGPGGPGMPAGPDGGQYLPRLELPEQQRAPSVISAIRGNFSVSVSGGRVQSDAILSSNWKPDALYAHFAAQLRAQGWEEEGGWQAALSAGGHWLREVDTNTRLSGLLSILKEQGDSYRLSFQLQAR